MKHDQQEFLRSERRLLPQPIGAGGSAADLIDNAFQAYNAARLREACELLVNKMMRDDCLVGITIAGALTPAGLGISCLIPLIEHGLIDWIVSTGANLYHDAHFGLDLSLYRGWHDMNDMELRQRRVIRIYDVVFEEEVLFDTDAFFRRLLMQPEFDHEMGTAEFHCRIGKYLAERERRLGIPRRSVLAAAFEYGIPVYTSSPGDSSIGMNAAAITAAKGAFRINTLLDVNETAALVYHAKTAVGHSGVLILGGGSPKNFALQTEPQLQEVLRFDVSGHDYFVQFTDARQDTGGLSGATPSEAVTWGKIDPSMLSHSVVCYVDSTIALPLLTSYVLTRSPRRAARRLYDRRAELLQPITAQAVKILQKDGGDTAS